MRLSFGPLQTLHLTHGGSTTYSITKTDISIDGRYKHASIWNNCSQSQRGGFCILRSTQYDRPVKVENVSHSHREPIRQLTTTKEVKYESAAMITDENLDQSDVAEKSFLVAKLADEVRLRHYTEQVLDIRQQELQSQEMENTNLERKIEELKKELSDTQSQLAEARCQNKAKGKQLQEAKEQVFHLQPQRTDVTEAEAVDGFKKLCGSVQRWVENRLKGILDDLDHGRLRVRPDPAQSARFVSFIREPARRCVNVDQSDEYHVAAVIMNYLWFVLFAKSFYCPLDDTEDDATLGWIDELGGTMTKLSRGIHSTRTSLL